MTYPEGRTPLTSDDMAKMHPSTWQQECEMLQEKVTELAMLVLAAEGQAEEAYQAQLSAESLASWNDIRAQQAIDEAKALRARVAKLETALGRFIEIAEQCDLPEWAGYHIEQARAALGEGSK
jgi:hypothetical protein